MLKEEPIFSQGVMDKAEYFCCYEVDEPEPYPPGDTIQEAISNYFEEVGGLGNSMDSTCDIVIGAFVDDGEEYDDAYGPPAIAVQVITVGYTMIKKLNK